MSFVNAQPDLMSTAATNLANIGSAITEANTAAAGQTTSVLAAGADETNSRFDTADTPRIAGVRAGDTRGNGRQER